MDGPEKEKPIVCTGNRMTIRRSAWSLYQLGISVTFCDLEGI